MTAINTVARVYDAFAAGDGDMLGHLLGNTHWVEAAGVYVTLHAGGEEFLYRANLSAVASRLDPFQFIRVHRSSLVNLKSVAFLERRSHGEFEIVLKNGTRLMLSRNYRADIEARLGQSL